MHFLRILTMSYASPLKQEIETDSTLQTGRYFLNTTTMEKDDGQGL